MGSCVYSATRSTDVIKFSISLLYHVRIREELEGRMEKGEMESCNIPDGHTTGKRL